MPWDRDRPPDTTARVFSLIADESRVLIGHQAPVTCVACHPLKPWAVTGSMDFSLRLWDLDTGQERDCWEHHRDIVTGAAFSGDGQFVASSSRDGTLRHWDLSGRCQTHCLRATPGAVSCVAYHPREPIVASGGEDRVVRVWRVDERQVIREWTMSEPVTGVAFSPVGNLVAACAKGQLTVWDWTTGELHRSFSTDDKTMQGVAFVPGSEYVGAAVTNDVHCWSLVTGQRSEMAGWLNAINGLAFTSDGRRVVTGNDAGLIHVRPCRFPTDVAAAVPPAAATPPVRSSESKARSNADEPNFAPASAQGSPWRWLQGILHAAVLMGIWWFLGFELGYWVSVTYGHVVLPARNLPLEAAPGYWSEPMLALKSQCLEIGGWVGLLVGVVPALAIGWFWSKSPWTRALLKPRGLRRMFQCFQVGIRLSVYFVPLVALLPYAYVGSLWVWVLLYFWLGAKGAVLGGVAGWTWGCLEGAGCVFSAWRAGRAEPAAFYELLPYANAGVAPAIQNSRRHLLVLLVAGLLFVGIFGWMTWSIGRPSDGTASGRGMSMSGFPKRYVPVADVYRDFVEDREYATTEYQDHAFQFMGRVSELNSEYLTLRPLEDGPVIAKCRFRPNVRRAAQANTWRDMEGQRVEIRVGQRLLVFGKCRGRSAEFVEFDECLPMFLTDIESQAKPEPSTRK